VGGRRDGGGAADGAAADGASADGAMDADGGPAAGCIPVGDGPVEPNWINVFVDGSPQPFPVASAFATWDTEACERPTLILGLSDGSCIPGFGQQLLILLARDDIGTSIYPGENILEAEPFDDAMRVRYFVPGGAAERDAWGSCTGAAGTVTFSDIDDTEGAAVRGTFSMALTDCVDPRDAPPATVSGAFDLTVPVAFETACP